MVRVVWKTQSRCLRNQGHWIVPRTWRVLNGLSTVLWGTLEATPPWLGCLVGRLRSLAELSRLLYPGYIVIKSLTETVVNAYINSFTVFVSSFGITISIYALYPLLFTKQQQASKAR